MGSLATEAPSWALAGPRTVATYKATVNVPGQPPQTINGQIQASGDFSTQGGQASVTESVSTSLANVGPPSAQISSPAGGQTFNLNQSVATSFSCSEAAGAPGDQVVHRFEREHQPGRA